MKIVSLTAENIKKITAVEIRPDGNMVILTGKNRAGKTSVLDSIWWALAGTSHIQAAPIRQGATEGRIRLDMGEIIVTRTFRTKEGAPPTSMITVKTAEGATFSSPQKMLDGLLGALSFDPLAFTRMDPRQQFDAMRRFVPDVDFDAIDRENKADFAKRQDINRRAKEARAGAAQIAVPSGLPAEFLDEQALTDRLAAAGEHNSGIERRAANRAAAAEAVARSRAEAAAIRDGITDAMNRAAVPFDQRSDDLGAEIARLSRLLLDARNALDANIKARDTALAAERERLLGLATSLENQAIAKQIQLDGAGPLPDPVDVSALRQEIADARRINDGIRQRNLRDRQIESAAALEKDSKAITEAMEARAKTKAEAIAKAALPVPGLGFGDGTVTLNGLPFDQASDAEQLRTSIAIAMASNPKLKVIRVRDGSLLDEDGMRLLAEMADAAEYQVWIERVGTGDVGFVLEDGHLKQADLQAAE